MKANAVVFTAPNQVDFQEVSCPEPGPDDVVLHLRHSWISNGTEGSYLRGERLNGDTPRLPGDPPPFPLVPGYQAVGRVETVGDRIKDIKPGDMVFAAVGRVDGMFFPVGGHISPMVAARDCVWPLPALPDPLAFSGMLLTQVGFNAGSRAPFNPGEWAVVIGDGLVGQWTAQTLADLGAQVIVLGLDDFRLGRARQLLDCAAVNVSTGDWRAAVRKLAPDGVAVAADVAGSRRMTEDIIDLMKRAGHIVSAGFCGTDDKISLQALRDRELSVDSVSSMTAPRMEQTLRLIEAGRLQTLPLITHRFPAAQAARAWSSINRAAEKNVLGVVLDW